MSFTIKCNNCGHEQMVTDATVRIDSEIKLYAGLRSVGYYGQELDEIGIDCTKCDAYVALDYGR